MAWIPMYLLPKDVELLNDYLNKEEEIAFLVSKGPKEWIASRQHDISHDMGTQVSGAGNRFFTSNSAEYNLWHIESGELPLLKNNETSNTDHIPDPWQGWTELRTGANPRIPYFGAGHPGIFHVEIKLPHDEEIRISTVGWIGNHYRLIGDGADPATEKLWKKLRAMIKKGSTQIPRTNDPRGKKEIFAFPSAYEEIRNGRPCALNPF